MLAFKSVCVEACVTFAICALNEAGTTQNPVAVFRIRGYVQQVASADEQAIALAFAHLNDLPFVESSIDGDAVFDGVFWGDGQGGFATCCAVAFDESARVRSAPRDQCESLSLDEHCIVAGDTGTFGWFGGFGGIEVHAAPGGVSHRANVRFFQRFFEYALNYERALQAILPPNASFTKFTYGGSTLLHWENDRREVRLSARSMDVNASLPTLIVVVSRNKARDLSEIVAIRVEHSQSVCHLLRPQNLHVPQSPSQLPSLYRLFPNVPDLTARIYSPQVQTGEPP